MVWLGRAPLSLSPGLIYAGVLAAAFEHTANKFSLFLCRFEGGTEASRYWVHIQGAWGNPSPILLQYRTHILKPKGVKWNKLGHNQACNEY